MITTPRHNIIKCSQQVIRENLKAVGKKYRLYLQRILNKALAICNVFS
jgi:hypothetical protein